MNQPACGKSTALSVARRHEIYAQPWDTRLVKVASYTHAFVRGMPVPEVVDGGREAVRDDAGGEEGSPMTGVPWISRAQGCRPNMAVKQKGAEVTWCAAGGDETSS